jgi:Second Messenger Oligonucleotide or Dinucleotide Synthetase domain
MTVAEAFQNFKSQLELPALHSQRASLAQQQLRARIGVHLPIQDSFLTGSYARHTKIHPLNDIDVMVVRNSARVGLSTSGGVGPSGALDEVAQAARLAFANNVVVKKQSRSVNLSFTGLEFGFDIIPAWLRQPDGYWIPDLESGLWIPTDPQAHERMMTAANERSDGRLKPVIKMVKHWSRYNLDLLCSFHLELISEWVFRQSALDNYAIGVALVLVNLPRFVGAQMMDPVYGLNRVDKPLSAGDLQKLRNRAENDAQNARTAIALEANGRHPEAIEKWKYIFLSGFPAG